MKKLKQKSIIEMTYKEAKKFFLKSESYCSIDLPQYFDFTELLKELSSVVIGKSLNGLLRKEKEYPSSFSDVNYTLLGNKDGRYSWRPFEIINPIIYVSLVNKITSDENWSLIQRKFKEFQANEKIYCASIPIESASKQSDKSQQISKWWNEIEQKSLVLALDFEHVWHTDITDCYPSIYTHSIPWALHTKKYAKTNRDPSLLGNAIDTDLRNMSYGQTNGIPQGSVLMDFISEIVLGSVDQVLSESLTAESITDYQILRYRDDYRIFFNNQIDGLKILKKLTEILSDYGLKINSSKTAESTSLIKDAIKADKFYYLNSNLTFSSLQKELLFIHGLAEKFPNSGSLLKALTTFYVQLGKRGEKKESIPALISIVVDIMYRNPKSVAVSSAILSRLLAKLPNDKAKKETVKRIQKKFHKIPNTGLFQLWLQRISHPIDPKIEYDEKLCKLVVESGEIIWNNIWLTEKLREVFNSKAIVNFKKLNKMSPIVSKKEFSIFDY